MCLGNLETVGQTNNVGSGSSSSTQTNQIDPTLRDYTTGNTDYLLNTRDAGYQGYPDQSALVAPMSNNQGMVAQQWIDRLGSDTDRRLGTAESYFRYYGDQPAQSVGTERVVDEGGKLGAISDYTSPYIKQVLEPQLQDLDEEGFRRNKEMNARAAMAGAFGDTGWEFGRAREADLTRRARDSAIANANQNAWDRAMALRQQDVGRFLDVDKTNANFQEQHLERMARAGELFKNLGIANTVDRMAVQSALMNYGAAQQSNDQARANIAYQEFSRATGFPLEVSQMLLSAINGSPLNRAGTINTSGTSTSTSTGTTQRPDNSGFQLLGSLLGSFL